MVVGGTTDDHAVEIVFLNLFIYFWSVVGTHADGILAAHYVTWHQNSYR
jgi:hypothetical protein